MQTLPRSTANSKTTPAVQGAKQTANTDLVRVFNTAMVNSRHSAAPDFYAELFALVETPALQAILESVRQLAVSQELTEAEAAEQIIQTFRKMDQIWSSYLYQEGKDFILKPKN